MQIDSPEAVGMSSERLARLSNHMAQLTADNQHPGIMTLIQRRGKVVHLGKHGLMDIEAGKPIAEDTIFRIQSMTKPIIAVAMRLNWLQRYRYCFSRARSGSMARPTACWVMWGIRIKRTISYAKVVYQR
jgi:hypothetical protein